MPLTPKQRQYLKGLAHPLSPVVRVGRGRVSPEVIRETERSLEAHELIKARIDGNDSGARRDLASALSESSGADLVAVIGKTAIFYRARTEKPKIKLP